YHNYSVQNASDPGSQRVYYKTDIPEFIHVTESCFVERELCVYFETQMAVSHASSQAIAQVYNLVLGQSDIPNASRLIHHLTGEVVLDSFLFHAILRDKNKRQEVLSIPHASFQNHRLDQALLERNYRMAGTGQDMWAHACDKCMKIYQGEDQRWYRMTAGVHDGVTVRHVCCSVHNCTESLLSQRDHFCQSHHHLAKECCVDTVVFRSIRKILQLQTSAASQVPTNSSLEPSTGTPIKGRTSRNWTHNEQLFVRCCGDIISRATFFGAEGITGVKDFLKATFPEEYPGSMPSYIFYDNNCQFLKHLRSCGDHYFDNVGLPVDVFHFKCKHTQTDIFCQLNCNPALFKELIGPNGEWIFNSSAAEQANVWFGKFQNTVQQMPALRFNFFLDEMIAIHNRLTVAELTRTGHRPHLQEEDLLRGLDM
ncbi:hypothetical protein GGX14DRAFT_369989, partial [Mycena pura]